MKDMRDRIEALVGAFKAMGDTKRLKIIKILASNMSETLCVSDVARILEISQPAASQHIKVLKNVGLLVENRKGFRVFYSIDNARLDEYSRGINELFRKISEKCPHDFSCEACSIHDNCGTDPKERRERSPLSQQTPQRAHEAARHGMLKHP